MRGFMFNVWIGMCRAVLPFSFVVAILVAPVTMLRGWREWPSLWQQMWAEPF